MPPFIHTAERLICEIPASVAARDLSPEPSAALSLPNVGAGSVLLTTDVPDQKTAWTKARQDVLVLTRAAGFAPLPLPANLSPAAWRRLLTHLGKHVAPGGRVLVEYPFEQRRRLYPLFAWCRLKRVALHGLIHDLHALRLGEPPGRELAILRLFDGLIAHNSAMSQWLRTAGYRGELVDLQLFDYLLAPHTPDRHWHRASLGQGALQVLCAGNLSHAKAGYIYDPCLSQVRDVEISLFGAFFEPERMSLSPVRYRGTFNPGTPELDQRYHFGLVWDGESAQGVAGHFGHYMRYNNPHKLSLYAALGLPVVVWQESAIARFVLAEGVGVAVHDLREIGDMRARVSDVDYVRMTRGMERLRQKVTSGHYLARALSALADG